MLSRRGIAATVAASATLGAGLVTPVVSAHAAAPADPVQPRLVSLDPLQQILALLGVGNLQTLIAGLSPAQLGDLLGAANSSQLTTLLDGLTGGQLTDALATLNPQELLGVLDGAGAGDLADVFAVLSPDQITSLLGGGGLGDVVAGLRAVAASLTAGTPVGSSVDELLGQVQAALAGVSPEQLGQLDALLGDLAPLLAAGGVDPQQLANLTALLQGITAPSAGVLGLLGILAPAGTPTDPGTGAPLPPPKGTGTGTGTGTGPGTGTGTGPGTGAGTGSGVTGFAARAGLRKAKLAKNRRSVRVKLTCPVAAPACLVALKGKVGARKAFSQRAIALAKGTSQTVRVPLVKRASKKLRKGGKLKLTAITGGSTLGAAKKSVKVKRAR